MTDVHREESETGKYALWVYIKNWIADYLKSTDLNIDGSKNVGVSVKDGCLVDTDLNIDGSKNLGVNVKTITEEDPDAATKNNPEYAFTYSSGRLYRIWYSIGAVTWMKQLTYNPDGTLDNITNWGKQ